MSGLWFYEGGFNPYDSVVDEARSWTQPGAPMRGISWRAPAGAGVAAPPLAVRSSVEENESTSVIFWVFRVELS